MFGPFIWIVLIPFRVSLDYLTNEVLAADKHLGNVKVGNIQSNRLIRVQYQI